MIFLYSVIFVLLVIWVVANHFDLKKKRDKDIIASLEALNKRSVEVAEEGENQLKIIKEEQVALKKYVKKNELVLYNVRERTLETWKGYNDLGSILTEVLKDDIGLEYEEVEVIHRIKYANDMNRVEIEKWFSNSFQMSVVDYLKLKDGINKYGFSNN